MDQKELRQAFNNIARDCKTHNREQLDKKYVTFRDTYPKLYERIINGVETNNVQETYRLFNMMVDHRQSQLDGKTNKLVTDMMVGNQLGRTFIYPVIGNPSQEEYNTAVRKLTQKDREEKEKAEASTNERSE